MKHYRVVTWETTTLFFSCISNVKHLWELISWYFGSSHPFGLVKERCGIQCNVFFCKKYSVFNYPARLPVHRMYILKLWILDKTMINELFERNYETFYRDFLLLESDLRPSNNVFCCNYLFWLPHCRKKLHTRVWLH